MGAVGMPAAPSYDFTKVKAFIAVPTRGTSAIAFSESLAVTCCALTLAKAEVSIAYHQANNFVDMSRNKLIARFMQSDCTHLFFVDDDMGWNAEAVLKMIAKDKDFIAGIGPLKTDSGNDYACHLYSNPDGSTVVEDGSDYLMKAQFVGGAFLILKRHAIQKMIDAYPELKSEAVDPAFGYSLFESKYRPLWMTEDYQFCERWRDAGGEIWCYPNIAFTHQGIKDWTGNYLEYRMRHAKTEAENGMSEDLRRIVQRDEQMNAGMIARGGQLANQFHVPDGVKELLCQSYISRVVKHLENIELAVSRIVKDPQ